MPDRRRPGKALEPWIYAAVMLSALGVYLYVSTGNNSLWVFKKFADAMTFIPVTRTLALYNWVTTRDARYPGRGPVLSQVVLIGEYYALFAHTGDICIKLLLLLGVIDPQFDKSTFAQGMYADNTFAFFTRILCHSILLNSLDESASLESARGGDAGNSHNRGNDGAHSNGGSDDSRLMIPV